MLEPSESLVTQENWDDRERKWDEANDCWDEESVQEHLSNCFTVIRNSVQTERDFYTYSGVLGFTRDQLTDKLHEKLTELVNSGKIAFPAVTLSASAKKALALKIELKEAD